MSSNIPAWETRDFSEGEGHFEDPLSPDEVQSSEKLWMQVRETLFGTTESTYVPDMAKLLTRDPKTGYFPEDKVFDQHSLEPIGDEEMQYYRGSNILKIIRDYRGFWEVRSIANDPVSAYNAVGRGITLEEALQDLKDNPA